MITEPDSTEPCEPGTNVLLQGIVWTETDSGVLVVNVTWRGKTYVGTLLDATKQEWAAPRVECESPASTTTTTTETNNNNKRNNSPSSTNDEPQMMAGNNEELIINSKNSDLLINNNENTFTPPPVKKFKTKTNEIEMNDDHAILNPSNDLNKCIIQSNGVVFPPLANENDYKDLMNKQQQQQENQHQHLNPKQKQLTNNLDSRKLINKKSNKKTHNGSGGGLINSNNELESINENILNLSGLTSRLIDNGSPAYSDISDATIDNKNEEKSSSSLPNNCNNNIPSLLPPPPSASALLEQQQSSLQTGHPPINMS